MADMQRQIRVEAPCRPVWKTQSFISVSFDPKSTIRGIIHIATISSSKPSQWTFLSRFKNLTFPVETLLERTTVWFSVSVLLWFADLRRQPTLRGLPATCVCCWWYVNVYQVIVPQFVRKKYYCLFCIFLFSLVFAKMFTFSVVVWLVEVGLDVCLDIMSVCISPQFQ